MEKKHSVEWCISTELAKQNKRLTTVLIIVVIMWIITITLWAVSNHIINNEAIDSANTHEVNICKDSLQTNGTNLFNIVASQTPNLK